MTGADDGRLGEGDVYTVDSRAWHTAIVVTVAAALVRLFFAARLPLVPDETYYWDWSRHLASGYFDHPPMIAVLIRAGTFLGGDTALAVRVFPVMAGALAALLTLDPDTANTLYASQLVGLADDTGNTVHWGDGGDLYAQEWGWFATALYAGATPDLWHQPPAAPASR